MSGDQQVGLAFSIFFLMCMNFLPAMCVYTPRSCLVGWKRWSDRSCGGREWKLGPLREKQGLRTSEPWRQATRIWVESGLTVGPGTHPVILF